MLFLIEAKITIRVPGVSGPFEPVCNYLVNAPNVDAAINKFEARVRQDKQSFGPGNSFTFNYLKIVSEI